MPVCTISTALPQDDRFQRHGRFHFARQVGVVEYVGIADAFAGHQLAVFATEGVAIAAAEIAEFHAKPAADPRIHLFDLAGKPVGRQPLGHRIGIEEGAVDLPGRGPEYAVQFHGIAGHGHLHG